MDEDSRTAHVFEAGEEERQRCDDGRNVSGRHHVQLPSHGICRNEVDGDQHEYGNGREESIPGDFLYRGVRAVCAPGGVVHRKTFIPAKVCFFLLPLFSFPNNRCAEEADFGIAENSVTTLTSHGTTTRPPRRTDPAERHQSLKKTFVFLWGV